MIIETIANFLNETTIVRGDHLILSRAYVVLALLFTLISAVRILYRYRATIYQLLCFVAVVATLAAIVGYTVQNLLTFEGNLYYATRWVLLVNYTLGTILLYSYIIIGRSALSEHPPWSGRNRRRKKAT